MKVFVDIYGRKIRLTRERFSHILNSHPELIKQILKISKTISDPEFVVKSKTDNDVNLYYKFFDKTPVGQKYFCVVVKAIADDYFILTAYFTDTLKRGDVLWTKGQ